MMSVPGSALIAAPRSRSHQPVRGQIAADLPELRLEWNRYRRYIDRCWCCQRTCQGRGDPEPPDAHNGPRARLLTYSSHAHLGSSMGKTRDLLNDFIGLTISRPGLLGHLRWGGQLFAPVADATA